MRTHILVNGQDVQFERNWFSGSFTYSVNGTKRQLASPLNPGTHFSAELSRMYEARVGDSVVRVIKTRPLLFAGFRPHNYKFFVNNALVKEIEEL